MCRSTIFFHIMNSTMLGKNTEHKILFWFSLHIFPKSLSFKEKKWTKYITNVLMNSY